MMIVDGSLLKYFFFSILFFSACTVKSPHDESIDNKIMSDKKIAGRPVVFYNVENLFDTENDPHVDDDEFTPYGYKKWDEERYETKIEHIESAIEMIGATPVLIGLAEIENRKFWKTSLTKANLRMLIMELYISTHLIDVELIVRCCMIKTFLCVK